LTFLTSAFQDFVLIENKVNAVIWVAMMRGLMDDITDVDFRVGIMWSFGDFGKFLIDFQEYFQKINFLKEKYFQC